MSSNPSLTQLLVLWSNGDESALEKLLPLVETELRRLASHYMQQERQSHTLQTTALINEAYIRLIAEKPVHWKNRAHFIGIAARVMRRILVDHARSRSRSKRGGFATRLDLAEAAILTTEKSEDLIALDEALSRLAAFDPLKSEIVEMRYFGGLTVEETAEVLKIAPITVSRHWGLARAWLASELRL